MSSSEYLMETVKVKHVSNNNYDVYYTGLSFKSGYKSIAKDNILPLDALLSVDVFLLLPYTDIN